MRSVFDPLRKLWMLLPFIVSSLVLTQRSRAQALPPIQNFSPADYQGENQNWGIAQAEDKRMYLANNKGLLQYDGARWKLYPSPNESILRSVRAIGNRIYSGCYMEFGFWEENASGILEYTSLSDNLGVRMRPDEEFWTILELDGNLVFQSLDRIYLYNPGENTIRTIDSDTEMPKVFGLGDELYFQRMGRGIFKLEKGAEVLVTNHPDIQSDEVVYMEDTPDGLRLLTRHRGFFTLKGQTLSPWGEGTNALLSEASVYCARRLEDGTYMLGTISGGVWHLNAEGRLLERFDQLSGLGNNTVLALLEDADRNIWLALDNGVSILDLTSPYRIFDDKAGYLGSVYTSAASNGYEYLGTNQGLFYKREGMPGRFGMVPGTRGQVWSLQAIAGTLFCNHHLGTFVVTGDQVRKIRGTDGSWVIRKIPGESGLLMLGSYDGIHILERSGNQWQLRNQVDGFEHSSRFLEPYGPQVFVNHEYKGVFRIQLDEGLTRALTVSVDTTLRGADSGLARFEGDLLYANREGVYRYQPARQDFQKDSVLSQIFDPATYVSGRMIPEPGEGRLWFFTANGIKSVSRSSLSGALRFQRIPLSQDARNGIAGYESLRPLAKKDNYLFGNRSGYIQMDLGNMEAEDFEVALSGVHLRNRGLDTPQDSLLARDKEAALEYGPYSLAYTFYTTSYHVQPRPVYQYRLDGIYPSWSPWTREAAARFENLPPGTYTLQVRARIGDTPSLNTAEHSFTVAKPWYLSSGMIALYMLGLILTGILVHLSYRKYYRSRQQKLLAGKQREMELIRERNDKEIIRLKNEQLKKQFQDKSNELAASTMSIIKKNEILSRVKHQLLDPGKDLPGVQPIVEIIDRNLKGSDDWEMFKEAFDNADRDFLDRLKSAHPKLTPNDIKLCAYLRLNLSSKEIAPLFNISVRSVEIKRYRLRKKMRLERDENLVNYILTL